jgi:hypothetical protein
MSGRKSLPISSMDTHAQLLGDNLAAGRAHLGRVLGIHQNHPPPSFFRFGDGHADELCPRHIQDAFAHPTAFAHLHRSQILKHDHLIGIHQLAALLVREVGPPVGGSGSASVSHEKQANHLPVRDRVSVTVLGVPSSGRCSTTCTAPTIFERMSRSPSNRTPFPY